MQSLTKRLSKLEEQATAKTATGRVVRLQCGGQTETDVDAFLTKQGLDREADLVIIRRLVMPGSNGPVYANRAITLCPSITERRHG